MRIASFFVIGVIAFGVSCGHANTTDLFAPPTDAGSQGATVAGTGGNASSSATSGSTSSGSTSSGSTSSGSTSSGSTSSASTSASSGSTSGGSGGSDQAGAGGASDTVGAGGAGGDPSTTTGMGGAGPGAGGTGGAGGGAGGPPDAGPADAGPGNDSTRRIRCGDTTCTALQQFCCIPNGRVPRCEPVVGGNCITNGDRLYCDDRSDCVANQVCCAADLPSTSSLADCRLPGACNGTKAQQLCDPQVPSSCMSFGTSGVCRADQNSTIDGYAYCR